MKKIISIPTLAQHPVGAEPEQLLMVTAIPPEVITLARSLNYDPAALMDWGITRYSVVVIGPDGKKFVQKRIHPLDM
jgi:hypothetical protein